VVRSLTLDRDQAFVDRVREIAAKVASRHADEVDRDGRFPAETLAALRDASALSAFVPVELGGGGVSFEAIAAACFELGRCCGSSAMVFAMHQIKIASIVRHIDGSEWLAHYLQSVAEEQRLVASVTTEVGTGGDLGRSIAAVSPGPSGLCSFEKQAPVISYGSQADDLFVTLRRDPDAAANDQVVAIVLGDQFTLEQRSNWDVLGMRGTCSPGYVVRAEIAPEQVMGTPFSRMLAETVVPVTHVLWSQLWLGIATDAFDRARASVRAAARTHPDGPPPAAVALSHVMTDLVLLRAEVAAGLADFLASGDQRGRERLATMAAALRFNSLKIAAAEQAPRVCLGAMGVCGIAGFRNDSPYSVARHLRDALSGALMIANERIHQTNASLLVIAKDV
jgi:acyl-CoA dehydrogenase